MEKKSGRVVFDDRGNSQWEWKTQTGEFKSDIDTQNLKKLTDTPLSLTDAQASPTDSNPYYQSDQGKSDKTQKRKSVDDLRQLSEQIKGAKFWKRDKE